MSDNYISEDYMVRRAITILENAIKNIKERDQSYNRNGLSYADTQLAGLESTWHSILECFTRVWNTKDDDKAEDWAAYSALQAAFIQEGIPQSRFSPAFRRFVPSMYQAIKENDILTGESFGEVKSKRAV